MTNGTNNPTVRDTMVATQEDIQEDIVDDARPASGPIEALLRLTKDLKDAARLLRPNEVRWLVQLFYEMQEQRIRAAAQVRAANAQEEPNELVAWMLRNYATLESDIRRVMDAYSDAKPEGLWLKSQVGIGPVLAAGLMAHIDITRAPSPSHIWSFAGLNPTAVWRKGEKRPWNAQLKVLAWKCGQSFVKTCNNPRAFYGPVYAQRKRYEQEQNEAGVYAEQAAAILNEKRLGDETVAKAWYLQGKLPPGHIQARAERYAVKLFLSHYHTVLHELYMPAPHPRPWAIEHGGHVDLISVPNWPL